jgi:hypothetical protein
MNYQFFQKYSAPGSYLVSQSVSPSVSIWLCRYEGNILKTLMQNRLIENTRHKSTMILLSFKSPKTKWNFESLGATFLLCPVKYIHSNHRRSQHNLQICTLLVSAIDLSHHQTYSLPTGIQKVYLHMGLRSLSLTV